MLFDTVPINVITVNKAYLSIINFSVVPKPPVKKALSKVSKDSFGDFLGIFIDDGKATS